MRSREAGFTISELLAVLLVGSFVMSVAAGLTVHAHATHRRAQDAATVVQEAVRTMERLEGDLRSAVAVDEAGPGLLAGTAPDGPFTWTLEDGDLVRVAGGGRAVLLRGAASLEAVRRGPLVEVTLRYRERSGGGTPPPLCVVAAPRAGGGAR